MDTENTLGRRKRFPQSKPSRGVARYVDANDLRALLKIALSLHAVGEPRKRLVRALDNLSHLAGANAWAATVLPARASAAAPLPSVLYGGEDAKAAHRLAEQILLDFRAAKTPIGMLVRTAHIPGRVLAALDEGRAIHSILRLERNGGMPPVRTWVSIARNASDPAFRERERRLAALFHSQSAWLLIGLRG